MIFLIRIFIGLLASVGIVAAQPTLKDTFQGKFLIGAAVNESQFTGENQREAQIIKTQFNTITPENVLKWSSVHPESGRYNFTVSDRYVEFGMTNNMFIIGHNLVWHEQTPDWVFKDDAGKPVSREVLLARMREHIFSVVGRYAGRIQGWDVVNEALNDDGTLRNSSWRKIIGDDYLVKAFEFAHAADPKAELYYNDYALEKPTKRAGVIALVKKLQAAGVHLTAIGSQEHVNLEWPTIQLVDDTLTEFSQLGIKVDITELDIDVLPHASNDNSADVSKNIAANPALNPYTNGLPNSMQQTLAQRYAELFAVYERHTNVIGRVTFWGVTDANSWLNYWPIHGRTNYPLLFDRAGNPKPAFTSIVHAQLLPPTSLSAKPL